jgi:VWFA-related protein
MTRCQAIGLWVMLGTCVAHAAGFRLAPQAPAAMAVHVPVSVHDGSRPIAGLVGAEFVLTDNAVNQEVEAITVDRFPIDVTLVIDMSGGASGLGDRLVRDVQQMAQLLRRDDGLRVLHIGATVQEIRPMSTATTTRDQRATVEAGASSVHDALIAAMVRPLAPTRRHLVVAITNGIDTMSVTTADRVREVASRADAVLQIVSVRPPTPYRSPTNFKRPRHTDRDLLILGEAAERTGGELHGPGVFADTSPVSAFKKALEDFQHSYVLRYSPRGVDREGWHELSVSVPKLPMATIRARHGYYAS